jgi:hypothetical protein
MPQVYDINGCPVFIGVSSLEGTTKGISTVSKITQMLSHAHLHSEFTRWSSELKRPGQDCCWYAEMM